MKIDLHNYEAFFLDYKEGNLSTRQEQELFLFLEQYPQLKEELDAFEELTLSAEETEIRSKEGYKKKEFGSDALIAYVESIADADIRRQIEAMAEQNIAFQKELLYYKSVRLEPETSVKFRNKSALKRGGVILLWQETSYVWRAAAALVLLLGLYFLFSTWTDDGSAGWTSEKIAQKNSAQETKPVENNSAGEKDLAVEENRTSASDASEIAEKKTTVKKVSIPVMNIRKDDAANEIAKEMQVVPGINNKALLPVPNDSMQEKTVLASNPPEEKVSYFNVLRDTDYDRENSMVTSAQPTRQSLFHRLAKAAKNANVFGIKKVNGTEEENTSTVSIGGLVISETNE